MPVTNMHAALRGGSHIPLVGLGTFQVKGDLCRDVVAEALRCGYRHIDTASVYRNEGSVAEGIALSGVPRSELFITSKLSPTQQKGYDAVVEAVNRSLTNLQTTYLDLYLIHWPGTSGAKPEDPRNAAMRRDSWRALQDLHTQGVCRHIGVSNYGVRHLAELVADCGRDGGGVLPHVNQFELHPKCWQEDVVELCRKHDIHVTAYSSLGQGALLADPVVCAVASELRREPHQVLLRWGIQRGCSVLPRTSKTERLRGNMDVFDFALSEDQMQRLNCLREPAGVDTHYCWHSNLIA